MNRAFGADLANALFVAAALIWAGMLIGVSFVATPIKFSAPSLSLPVALDVGRVTFHLFSRIEWGLAAILLLTSVFTTPRGSIVLALLLAILVALQAVWLLPVLDERVAAIIAGDRLPPSGHHTLYGILEVIKLLLLAGASAWSLRAMRRPTEAGCGDDRC